MKNNATVGDTVESSSDHETTLTDVRNKMIGEQRIIDMSALFKLLGDTTRVSILAALSVTELCVCDIALLLRISNSAISHQLRLLKQTHIVRSRRVGKTVYYRMADGHIMELLKTALEHSNEE